MDSMRRVEKAAEAEIEAKSNLIIQKAPTDLALLKSNGLEKIEASRRFVAL